MPFISRRNSLVLRSVVLSFLSLGAGVAAPAVDGMMPEDSLPELKVILEAALKQSPQMILKEIEISQTQAARYIVDATRWPDLGGFLSYASEQSAVSSNTSSKSKSSGLYYSLGISQSFFQWGALKNQTEIGKLNVAIAEKNYAEAYRLLAASLRTQYLALVVQKATLNAVKFRAKISENALEIEEQKLKNGAISVGDIIGPRLALEEAHIGVERLQESYDHSKRLFAHMAGYEAIDDEKISASIGKPAYSRDKVGSLMAYLQQETTHSGFLVEIYNLNAKQADLNYRIAKVRLLPKFYFGANASQINQNNANVSAGIVSQAAISSQSANVSAQWKLFDGFATRGAKLSALASKRYYERLAKTQIQANLDSALNQQKMLAISARTLDLTETRLGLADSAKTRVSEEYKLGNTPQTTVDETTALYYNSDVAALTARAEFLTRWGDFVSLIGADPLMNQLPARYVR